MEYLNLRILLVLVMAVFAGSCGENYKNEKAQIEALKARLEEGRKFTSHDVLELKSRSERITNRVNFLKAHKKDSLTEEYNAMLENYAAISRVYTLYADHYILLQSVGNENEKRLLRLESVLDKDDFDRKEYSDYYETTLRAIADYEREVDKYGKPVFEVELLYNRLDEQIQKEIDKLKSRESRFKKSRVK